MSGGPGEKKTICLVIDGFGYGGVQQSYKVLISEYCKVFSSVYLIIIQTSKNELEISNFPNLKTIRIEGRSLFNLKKLLLLRQILYKIKPDFIIASIFRSQIWSAAMKPYRSKLIWIEHNTYSNRRRSHWWLMKIMSQKVYKIVGVSDEVSELTKVKLQKKCITIANPLSIQVPKHVSNNRSNDFIFVARMNTQKNPHLMLESFAYFQKKYKTNSVLHFIGDGMLLENVKTQSRNLGIYEKCKFHGWLAIESVQEIMLSSKTLVSTSMIEGMSLVRLEALANGCCVVTTNTGGASLFKDMGKYGFFLSAPNPIDIADAMMKSLSPQYWNSNLLSARTNVIYKFNPKVIANNLIS